MTSPTPSEDRSTRVMPSLNTASTYDNIRFVRVSADRLVAGVSVSPGARVLDVGTGTGWVASALAPRVGPTGQIVGVDISQEMLDAARRKAELLGIRNVELRLGDGARLEFADASFDAVLSSSVLFWIPDMLAALREWRRVTKPGGLIAFTSFGQTFRQPFEDLFLERLQKHGGERLEPPSRRLANPSACRDLMVDAGLERVEVRSEPGGYYLGSVDEYWNIEVELSVFRRGLAQLPPQRHDQFKAEHLAEVGALATPQGIWVDVPVNLARGWKP